MSSSSGSSSPPKPPQGQHPPFRATQVYFSSLDHQPFPDDRRGSSQNHVSGPVAVGAGHGSGILERVGPVGQSSAFRGHPQHSIGQNTMIGAGPSFQTQHTASSSLYRPICVPGPSCPGLFLRPPNEQGSIHIIGRVPISVGSGRGYSRAEGAHVGQSSPVVPQKRHINYASGNGGHTGCHHDLKLNLSLAIKAPKVSVDVTVVNLEELPAAAAAALREGAGEGQAVVAEQVEIREDVGEQHAAREIVEEATAEGQPQEAQGGLEQQVAEVAERMNRVPDLNFSPPGDE